LKSVEIADLCKEFDAMLFVDDAHGTGVFGDSGRGTPEKLGVEDRVDFWVGSTAQGLGVRGGYNNRSKRIDGIPAPLRSSLRLQRDSAGWDSGCRLSGPCDRKRGIERLFRQAAQPKEFNLKLGAERLSRSAQQAAEPRFFDTFRPTGLDNTFAVARIGEIGKAR
jgi:hypothetical protein